MFLDVEQNKLSIWQVFSAGLSNRNLHIQRKDFFWKNNLFQEDFRFVVSDFWSFSEFFVQGCQNCVLHFPKNFLANRFFWKNLFFGKLVQDFGEIHMDTRENLLEVCQHRIQLVQMKNLRRNLFLNEFSIVQILWYSDRKMFGFLAFFSAGLSSFDAAYLGELLQRNCF